ncbi:MAG: ABC transporter substrate-binding protein [Saccharolobus sp.]
MKQKVYNPILDSYIELPRPLNTIVSLDPASTEIIFLLGFGSKVKATDAFSYRPNEARKTLKIGSYTHVNLEQLELLKPDIIFTTTGVQKELTKKLLNLGFNVYPIPLPNSIAGILNNVLLIGNVIGAYDEARKMYIELNQIIFQNIAKSRKLRKYKIYVEFDLGGPITIGFPTHISDAISILDGVNIFDDYSEAYFTPKSEDILERDPDIIIYEPKKFSEDQLNKFHNRLRERGLDSLINKPIFLTKGDYLAHMGPSFITDSLNWLSNIISSLS